MRPVLTMCLITLPNLKLAHKRGCNCASLDYGNEVPFLSSNTLNLNLKVKTISPRKLGEGWGNKRKGKTNNPLKEE